MTIALRIAAALAMIVCVSLTDPARAETDAKCQFLEIANIPVVMEGNRVSLAVSVNGKQTRLWLDSGAFFNVMPKATAVELGLETKPMPWPTRISGIGGSFVAELANVRDFQLAGVLFHNVKFMVGGNDPGNGFMGANLIAGLDTELDLARGAVRLFKPSGCGQVNLAYWGKGMAVGEARLKDSVRFSDNHIYLEVLVNGHPLRAALDTGAPISLINRHAAERVGINMKSPDVLKSAAMGGAGAGLRQSWIARPAIISIGGELIQNSPIHIIEDNDGITDWDVLLGMDFLIAHRVLVSQSQHKMYLTYNGGPIFSATTERETGHLETRAQNMGIAPAGQEPDTADGFVARAATRSLDLDLPGAIADYTAAIRLAPGRADLLSGRARLYGRNKQFELAAKDIDAALAITPTDYKLLISRAQTRLGKGDKAGALADTDAAAAAAPKGSLDSMQLVGFYQRLGRADRGLVLLDPIIELHHDSSAYASLVNTRNWMRGLAYVDLDRALADSNRAIRDFGQQPYLIETRALVQLRRKAYAAAMADAGRAIDKAPKAAAARYVRALARFAAGDAAGAGADLAAARALDPNVDKPFADYGLVIPDATAAKNPQA